MHTNWFSIDWLIGVHISSIVNEVIRTISNQFISLWKDFECTEMQIPQNQPKKTDISEQETKAMVSNRVAVWCFLYAQNLFRKKQMNWF